MKSLSFAFAVLGAAVMFTACNSNKNYKALIANEWSLDKIEYADSNYSEDAPEGIYIVFADSNKVSGKGVCNRFFGRWDTLGEDNIAVENLGTTRMACNDNGFEYRFFELLSKVAMYQAGDHELVLNGVDNKFTMRFSVRVEAPEVEVDVEVVESDSTKEEVTEVTEAVEVVEPETAE